MLASSILTAALFAAGASAHATFQELWVNGVDKAKTCVRPPASNSPVTSISTNDLACNVNGNNAVSGSCDVAAGDSISVEMHEQPDGRSCSSPAIGGQHNGPVLVYMAKVDSLSITNPSSLSWFKIGEMGLIKSNYWATDYLNDNCGKATFKVPADIAPGNYLLRAEVIALHVASSIGGAQFYMSCYQLKVSGTGTASPSGVKFPGAYSATDPGILFNVHGTYSSYTIPGPPVYGGGAGPAPTTANPGTTAGPTTTKTTAAPAPTGPVIQKYGQCGGTGWTGGTNCASGSTCTKSNDYYSQCL